MMHRQGDQVTTPPRSSVTSHTSGCLLVFLAARLAPYPLCLMPPQTPASARGLFLLRDTPPPNSYFLQPIPYHHIPFYDPHYPPPSPCHPLLCSIAPPPSHGNRHFNVMQMTVASRPADVQRASFTGGRTYFSPNFPIWMT